MANMIPRFIDTKEIQPGEKLIYELLDQTLSDEYFVRYEPKVNNKFPDFIVFGPKLGILILEIKDWSKSFIRSATDRIITTNDGVERPNPLKQVTEYRNIISGKSKEMFNERYKYALNTIVVFVNMSKTDFDSIEDKSNKLRFADLLDGTGLLFKEDLAEMANGNSSEKMINILREHMTFFKDNEFSLKDANDIRLLLNPSIFIKNKVDQTFSILNDKQESYSQKIPDDHKIIVGPAGSGKSIILQSQAKHVLSKIPDAKVLYICFNKVLLSDLRHIFNNHDIDIYSIGKLPSDKTYDFIFVDEGQDLGLESYKRLIDLRNSDRYGFITVACDGAQNLYDNNFLFSDILFDESHIEVLNTNYRCSLQTHVYATEFLDSNKEETDSQVLSSMYMPQTDRHYRQGAAPIIKTCLNLYDQYKYVTEQVKYLLDTNTKERSIAVFCPTNASVIKFMNQNDNKQGLQFNYIYKDDIEDRKDRYRPEDDTVLVTTYHSSKGLEFDHVFVVLPDILQYETKFKKAIYVAMTRSIKQLYVVTNVKSAYVDFIDTAKKRYDESILVKTSQYNNSNSLVLEYDINHSFDIMKLAKDLNQFLGHQLSDLNQLLTLSTDDKRLNESYEMIEELKEDKEILITKNVEMKNQIAHLKNDQLRQYNEIIADKAELTDQVANSKSELKHITAKLIKADGIKQSLFKEKEEMKSQVKVCHGDLGQANIDQKRVSKQLELKDNELKSKQLDCSNLEEDLKKKSRQLTTHRVINLLLVLFLVMTVALSIMFMLLKTDKEPSNIVYGPFEEQTSMFDTPVILAQFEVYENKKNIPSCYIAVDANEYVEGFNIVGSKYSVIKTGDNVQVYKLTKQDRDLKIAKVKEYEMSSYSVDDKLVFTFSNPYIKFSNLNSKDEKRKVDEFIQESEAGYILTYDFELNEMVYLKKNENN